ncbi:30S ribosomal protein S6 alpha, chloroplastic-like [Camellia sinensis]|uniref:30S ribosomal protein S6 alpha, chloroplastic-like n=1 Tax=Camellia sinensis TaxID=4442 RepID=UPI0010365EF1|nr:30S ribosomal protein S6 alpha, chloroplastic-like [Camellia sinensis]
MRVMVAVEDEGDGRVAVKDESDGRSSLFASMRLGQKSKSKEGDGRSPLCFDEIRANVEVEDELLVAGGGMYVEVFNIGVILLAYSIKKKNKAGESNTYLDGIYLLFTYFTKPESMAVLEGTLQTDDDVIRSSTFKIRKRKY